MSEHYTVGLPQEPLDNEELKATFLVLREFDVEYYKDATFEVKFAPKKPAPFVFPEIATKQLTDDEMLDDPYQGLTVPT